MLLFKTMINNKSKKYEIKANKDEANSSTRAKIVLIIFGIGPILLMGLFLFSNGFFSAPNL